MKKYTLVLALIAALPMFSASGYEYNTSTSNDYYTERPAAKKANNYKKATTTRKSGGYNNTVQNNFYYSQPKAKTSSYEVVPRQNYSATRSESRSSESRSDYSSKYDDNYVVKERQVRKVNRTYSTQERKFFLAHPFFQPLKGKFGSVTDFSYAKSSFDFNFLNGNVFDIDPSSAGYSLNTPIVQMDSRLSGKAETTQMVVKEDFSIGLSDTLTVIGMLQYDKTDVKFKDWKDPANPNFSASSDSNSDSGLNIFGLGLQYRFVDSGEWIAMASGYYQHQRDTANTFIGELKVGYKIDRTTVYGLGRVGYSDLTKGDIYGAYVENDGDYIMLAYKTDVKDILYVEGGLGVFSVLSKDFTVNGELVYGHYDWHDQLNIKGGIGWQPGDMFALNLYASTSLYDNAEDKTNHYMQNDVNPDTSPSYIPSTSTSSTNFYTMGDYKIKDYNEWKVGIQAIFYF